MHGRIETTVLTEYKNATELITETRYIGTIFDGEKNIITYVNQIGDPLSTVLAVITKNGVFKSEQKTMLSHLKQFDFTDILLFENLKEATDWLYRSEEREAVSEKGESQQTKHRFKAGDNASYKGLDVVIVDNVSLNFQPACTFVPLANLKVAMESEFYHTPSLDEQMQQLKN